MVARNMKIRIIRNRGQQSSLLEGSPIPSWQNGHAALATGDDGKGKISIRKNKNTASPGGVFA